VERLKLEGHVTPNDEECYLEYHTHH